MSKYLTTKQVLIDRILHESIFVNQVFDYSFVDGRYHYTVIDTYNTCKYFQLDNGLSFFEIAHDSPLLMYNDLFDISFNERYTLENMYSGFVVNGDVIIEGTDGTGKSSISKILALDYGILCEDRNVKGISKHISNDISMQIRMEIIAGFLESSIEKEIVILILSDLDELKKRIYARERVSEYDKMALESQKKYIIIFNELIKKYSNVHLFDTFGKSIEETKDYVLSLVKTKPKDINK